ncbi:MAG: hypothetical protein ACJ8AT_08915 [Hyalangium sp.]|uniref:hypothetical protein n=1 Tax=Hyalangium sp. TaxID=2028555 RepID=UPI00389AE13E
MMLSLLEPQFTGEPQAAGAPREPGFQASSGDVWLRESVPAEFLREVVDTLTGVLRADREAEEARTPYVLP